MSFSCNIKHKIFLGTFLIILWTVNKMEIFLRDRKYFLNMIKMIIYFLRDLKCSDPELWGLDLLQLGPGQRGRCGQYGTGEDHIHGD